MDDWRVNCFSIIYRGCNHSNLSTKIPLKRVAILQKFIIHQTLRFKLFKIVKTPAQRVSLYCLV